MTFEKAENLIRSLKAPKILDAKDGVMRPANEYELEAAAMIESLLFQLKARIEASKT